MESLPKSEADFLGSLMGKPNVEKSAMDTELKLKEVFEKCELIPEKAILEKATAFIERISNQKGLALIGPTMSGKTSLLKVTYGV